MNKSGLACPHITMKSEDPFCRELPPELPRSRLDFLQTKANLHAVKIATFAVYMETINWKVEGMNCSTCALTIGKYLEKKGGRNVRVSLVSGDVSFDIKDDLDRRQLQQGINNLGYTVVGEQEGPKSDRHPLNMHLRYFLFSLPFTLLLMLPMTPGLSGLHVLMHPWVQLLIGLPVYLAGARVFGRRAIKSLLNGSPD